MSGSRGPLSDSNAIRRNPKAPGRELPLDGYQGDYPDWPYREASEIELLLWDDLWRSPMATEWVTMGRGVARQVARLVRLDLVIEGEMKNSVATGQTLSALLALEKQLGIGPEAMKRLEWVIRETELEQPERKLAAVRRIAAVDPTAS